MKTPGYVLAVIGIIVVVIAAVNHFVTKLPVVTTINHGSIIVGVVGAVVFLIGAFLAMRKAA
jgi:hypothetical protein